MSTTIKGYHPGPLCEERTQWIFEGDRGEGWAEEMMTPLFEVIIPYIEETREKYGWDVTNFFEFSFSDHPGMERLYFVTRARWQFNIMAFSPEELAQKLKAHLDSQRSALQG